MSLLISWKWIKGKESVFVWEAWEALDKMTRKEGDEW
jgi:hypothetical protein